MFKMAEVQQANQANSDNNSDDDYQNPFTNPAFHYAKANDIPIFTFTLNHQNMSTLNVPGLGKFDAFSGQKQGRNNPNMTAVKDNGPLPKGIYYIVARIPTSQIPTDTLRVWYHYLSQKATDEYELYYGVNREDFFNLYRSDDNIDDKTLFHGINRGQFRLHPLGPMGVSEGCITLPNKDDFYKIRNYLLNNHKKYLIPGVNQKHITAYGIIIVQ